MTMAAYTLDQIRKMQHEIENEIALQINEFSDRTGLTIERVDLTSFRTIAGKPVGYNVKLEIKI
jgi:hypothetical protein